MRITRRQLRQIINESLFGKRRLNETSRFLNFNKIRKDLEKLESDPNNQELLDKITEYQSDLDAKVNAGPTGLGNRFREAQTLLAALSAALKNPEPAAIKKATQITLDIEKVIPEPIPVEPKPEPKPTTPGKWVPDPQPGSNWEYQLRECIWFAREKGKEKEFKLGHASGKPAEKEGKFLKSIVRLNKAYPEMVKACNGIQVVPPNPTPTKGGSGWPDNAISLINGTNIPGKGFEATIKKWKGEFAGACRGYVETNGKSLNDFLMGMNPGTKFATIYEWLSDKFVEPGSRDKAASLIDKVNEMSAGAKGMTGVNNHDRQLNPLKGQKINESFSRGELYRRRYRR